MIFDRTRTARQIALFFAAGFVVAAMLLGCIAYVAGRDAIETQIDARVGAEMSALQRLRRDGGAAALRATLGRREERGVNDFGYLLVDSTGKRLAGEIRSPRLTPGWDNAVFHDDAGDEIAARSLTADMGGGLRLTVLTETAPTAALLRTTILLSAWALLFLILLAIGCGLLFGRALRRRLEGMNRAAVAIIAGQLDSRIEISGRGDEFDQLGQTLNAMLDRIGMLVANVRQVSSDVAHELRTPITHLQNRLEVMLQRFPVDSEDYDAIDAAIEDSEHILALFAALLRISEVESGSLCRYFQTFDLSERAVMVSESYIAVAEDRAHVLRCDIQPGVLVEGDAELLSQAMINLIENALKHTPEGTVITLSLARIPGDGTVVRVSDNGPGVTEEEMRSLPQRFLRLDRSGPAGGHGLGLALVAAIAGAHRGRIAFEHNSPGLSVRLVLPSDPATADLAQASMQGPAVAGTSIARPSALRRP